MIKNKTATKVFYKKEHVCDICKKVFKYKCRLKKHMLVHTGEKDFECHACLKKFARKYHLTQHMVTHTKEKNFKCDLCQKKIS